MPARTGPRPRSRKGRPLTSKTYHPIFDMDQWAFWRRRSMHMHSYGARYGYLVQSCRLLLASTACPSAAQVTAHTIQPPQSWMADNEASGAPFEWRGSSGGIGYYVWRILSLSLLSGRLDPTSPSATPQLLAQPASLHAHPSSARATIHARCSEALAMALRQFPSPALGWQRSGRRQGNNEPAKLASRQNHDALGCSLCNSSLTGIR